MDQILDAEKSKNIIHLFEEKSNISIYDEFKKRILNCSVCGEIFDSSEKLENHLRNHLRTNSFPCSRCDKVFSSALRLAIHEQTHSLQLVYKCGKCRHAFSHKADFDIHVKNHENDISYKCPVCQEEFEIGNLTVHMLTHSRENYDSFKNIVQHKNAKTTQAVKNVSDNEKLLGIREDDKSRLSFENGRRNNLKINKRVHTKEKPYTCEYCEKTFKQSSQLAVHRRIHTGEKPHKCEFCKKSFSAPSNLVVHKRIHTGVKSYKCEYCEKAFNQSSSLKRHKKIHTR